MVEVVTAATRASAKRLVSRRSVSTGDRLFRNRPREQQHHREQIVAKRSAAELSIVFGFRD